MLIKKTNEYLTIEQIVDFVNKDFLRFWSIEIVFISFDSSDSFNIKTPLFNYDFYSEYYYNSMINAKYIPYYPDGIPDIERKKLIKKRIDFMIDKTVSTFDNVFLESFKEKKYLLFYMDYSFLNK